MALRGLNACARIILTDASRAAAAGALQSDCLKCRHGGNMRITLYLFILSLVTENMP